MKAGDIVEFHQYSKCPHCDEHLVPPSVFYVGPRPTRMVISQWMPASGCFEAIRLSPWGLVWAMVAEPVTALWWRFMATLWDRGFMTTTTGTVMTWRDFTPFWWRTLRSRENQHP